MKEVSHVMAPVGQSGSVDVAGSKKGVVVNRVQPNGPPRLERRWKMFVDKAADNIFLFN